MAESKLREMSMNFSVDIINLVKYLKSNRETGYWLELLHRTNYIDAQQYKTLSDKCVAIRVILIASCKTEKEKKQ